MIKDRYKMCSMLLAVCLCVSACGKTDEEKALADFSSSISAFTTTIKDADTKINELDVTAESASEELLDILDQLQEEFEKLAQLPVPDQYHSIEDLADEASENMNNSVSYFHTAYEADTFDPQDADIAYQYYTRAMTRIEYIGYVLSGDIPENEHVTVYEETNDSSLIDKLLQNSDSNITTGEIIENSTSE